MPTPGATPTPAPNVPEPGQNAAPVPSPVSAPSLTPEPTTQVPGQIPTPVNPVYQPTNSGVKATEPIMMPEPAPQPDPIEEELKAPMKAADPVPGSIGSAISGTPTATASATTPTDAGNTPSVAFNDPATQPEMPAQNMAAPVKKKNNKMTLIILIAVAAVIVVALAIILILQLTSGNGSSSSSNNSNSQSNSNSNVTPTPVVPKNKTLSCTRNMTVDELVEINDAVSGTVSSSVEFDENGDFVNISLVKSVVYNDEGASNEPVEMEVHEATADDLTSSSMALYDLPVDENGDYLLYLDDIQGNYESLDFTCEVL